MPTKELLDLRVALTEERRALLSSAVEEILRWANYKARIVESLRGKALSPDDRELLLEILEENERNKRIVEAGLSFVEEAYSFLQRFLTERETYCQGKNQGESAPKVFSKRA